jgi:hypothetical protein
MKTSLTMSDLDLQFRYAISEKYKLFAVAVQLPGLSKPEIIINCLENAKEKLDYYKQMYSENLVHWASGTIKIVDWDYADYVDELKFFENEG